MTDKNDKIFPTRNPWRRHKETRAKTDTSDPFISNDDLRKDMELQSLQVRDLILAQPPVQLLGYLWAQFYRGFLADPREKDESCTSNKELIDSFQFALEYIHAVWSCHAQLDESKATALIEALEELKNTTIMYCMASASANTSPEGSSQSADTEFRAKSTWVLIRGHRYQVLEEEFFAFVLEPHADALRAAYGMEFDAIAAGIQAVADTMRTGFSKAIQKIQEGMKQTYALAEGSEDGYDAAIEKLKEGDGNFTAEIRDAIHDLFYGGICNLSRHTNFTSPLLEDLSYLPGGNAEFFADGDFKGTPMRTLPASIKPGISRALPKFCSITGSTVSMSKQVVFGSVTLERFCRSVSRLKHLPPSLPCPKIWSKFSRCSGNTRSFPCRWTICLS